jgi:hypothetical protein
MTYKVFFHSGDDLTLKTRVLRGKAWVDGEGLHISGTQELVIPKHEMVEAELFRLHGLGRVIRLKHANGQVYVSVVRLMIGQFAFINFFKTGKLLGEIKSLAGAHLPIR